VSNLDNPKYRAAMEANAKLIADSGEKRRNLEDAIPLGHPLRNLIQAVAEAVDGQYKNKMQSTNALLMFGPAHGQTMVIPNNTHGVLWEETWQETEPPIWEPVDYSKQRPIRRRTHTYRREDEYESSNMEECTIFVHDEKCCDARMPNNKRAT